VKAPAISITIEASPVKIDRITVGNPVELSFTVDGIPPSDQISSFAYAIWKGNEIYKETAYLNRGRAVVYTDRLAAFTAEGDYKVVATATTLGQSVGVTSRPFTVLSAEIRKKTFTLDGNPNQLFIGAPLYFKLELENPNQVQGLSVRMYVTKEDGAPISGLGPITAESTNHATYRNVAPFIINESGTYTAYASVTLLQPPQIDLPTMRSDADYFIPPPNVGITVDETKQYLAGYAGTLRVTVTIPIGMEIQPPSVGLVDESFGEVDPTPYTSDLSGTTVKYYSFKFTPTKAGSPVVHIAVYDAADSSKLKPLMTKDATLSAIEFRPHIRVTGTAGGENRFIQVKDPEIRMELTQIPEFYNGTYLFEARLNGNPTKVFPVITTTGSATASFDAAYLYNLSGNGAATVTVNMTANRDTTFQASGVETFNIVYPSISNPFFPDYVTNKIYTAYQECQMVGRFNNIDKALKLLAVDLYMSDGTSTKTYDGVLELSEETVQATALFNKVVFESVLPHQGYFAVYSANSNPRHLLATSPVASFTVANTGSFVDIIYPHKNEAVFAGITLKPVVRLTNIPGVINVMVTILDSSDAEIVLNGRTQEATSGYWVLADIDAQKITTAGDYRVIATVESSILGPRTEENPFKAIDGDIRIDVVTRKTGGTLIFPTEYLEFETSMSFENPYASPTEFASLTRTGGGGEVPVDFISRTISYNGALKNYLSTWRKSQSATLEATDYTLTFSAEYGLSKESRTITFNVLPTVATPAYSKSHGTIVAGNQIEGYITYLLPRDATSTIIPFIGGNVTFENATPNGKETTLSGTDPSYVQYVIISKAIPKTAGRWKVEYHTQLDEQIFRYEETYIVTETP